MSELSHSQLALDFQVPQETACTIRVSKRAKKLSLYLYKSGKVEVVAPQRASKKRIQKFIYEHKNWIYKNRKKLNTAETSLQNITRPDLVNLVYLDQSWKTVYRPSAKNIIEHDNWLELPGNKTDEEIVKAIAVWLKRKAEVHITPLIQDLSKLTQLSYRKVTFRGQKTRWGSCSPNGTISLNYCLLFLPHEYVRYVLLHELCHLQEMNHSSAFWSLVKQYQPNYKRLDKKINDYWVNLPDWLDLRFTSKDLEQEVVVINL